jgi:hypothetical protein
MADWFDAASISENDRLKIGRLNSARPFGLGDSEADCAVHQAAAE